MTVVTKSTQRARVARGALIGAIVMNVPTLAWGWYAGTAALIVGIVAAAVLGGALGGLVAWMGAPNRWARWWSGHRRHPRPDETLPPPGDVAP